jgi:hypothetical protein
MSLQTFIVGATLLAVFGFMGFRVLNLEQRVAVLTEELGAPRRDDAASRAAQPDSAADTAGSTPANQSLEQRLQAIDRGLEALNAKWRAQSSQSSASPQDLDRESAILSVVERENNRVRDKQLAFYRQRWLEGREQQLAAFAAELKLQPEQRAELYKALEHEVDALITVLKNPDVPENPDVGVSDLLTVLSETDQRAKQLLTPAQSQAWTQARTYERHTLWPWLSDGSAARK